MEVYNTFSHYSPVYVCDGVGVGIPLFHAVIQGHRLFILFFFFFFFFLVGSMSSAEAIVGLELKTLRSRVVWSTDWASQASWNCYSFEVSIYVSSWSEGRNKVCSNCYFPYSCFCFLKLQKVLVTPLLSFPPLLPYAPYPWWWKGSISQNISTIYYV